MRIGILTLPLHTNYGGLLQAYALQTVLEKMGHEAVVLDTPNRKSILKWSYPLEILKRCISKFLLRRPTRVFFEQWFNKTYPIISRNTQPFIANHIHRLEIKGLKSLSPDSFDAFVVGSDQVWRPAYFTRMYDTSITNAYLAFARNWKIKRVSYAASFGTDSWEYSKEQTKNCAKYLKMFNAVSTRESSGAELCKKHFGVNATHVIDPTMLLTKEDYVGLINNSSTPKSKGNMLCYILDETKEKTDVIDFVAKSKGLTPFKVNSKVGDFSLPVEERVQPAVETWLRGFYDADFVVTDSFHACVFSTLFQKPFVIVGNKERGLARFHSLLATYGLEDCLASGPDTVKFSAINWEEVSKILNEKRNEAFEFLSKALK